VKDFPWEDNLLERKVESDLKDVLKTLVGFANSVKPGHTAVLLIGEKDDGNATGVTNPDTIQKRIRSECDKIYPPILWRSKIYENQGKQCVCVEIEYNDDTPHFAGPAYVRKGSETIQASNEMFQQLIDIRSNIVSELSKWLNKEVIVVADLSSLPPYRDEISGLDLHILRQMEELKWAWKPTSVKVFFVNNFWCTLEMENGIRQSLTIEKIYLSYDDNKKCLKLYIRY